MLEFKKVYVDSRFKSIESNSNSDFKFELPDDIALPNETRCYIDDITIPVTWYSVETNMNDRIYIRTIQTIGIPVGINTDRILTMDAQNYDIESFRDALQIKLNNTFGINKFTVEGSKRTNVLVIKTIVLGEQFEFWTDDALKKGYTRNGPWNGPDYDRQNLMSFNSCVKNTDGTTGAYSSIVPYYSGFVDFLNIHNVYIHSNLSSYDSMNAFGRSNIIKKVCITTSWGFLQNDNVVM